MTELVWDGKYKDGKKVGPVRIQLPFQTVETVNESAQQRQMMLDLFTSGQPTEWRNRLIWGDKKYVLPSLLPEFAGKVTLVYIDPPFNVGADFSYIASVPESEESFIKEPSMVEVKAYRDTWGNQTDSYLKWLYETFTLIRELLSDAGSLFVHLDWRMVHYARVILDEVFSFENFRNQITWKRQPPRGARAISSQFARSSDSILFYTKSANANWNPHYKSYDQRYVDTKFKADENGRLYRIDTIGSYSEESIAKFRKEGKIYDYPSGKIGLIRYLDEAKGEPLSDIWLDIAEVNSQAIERLNYPTQKPEALLERIIKASSNEGDLILDCFCGSGTTAAVAEKLGRRWIACDLGRFAIHTTRKRLLSIENVKPFVVQNLGKYERQVWQTAEFADPAQRANIQSRYRHFILDLYNATPVDGYTWLHGIKAGRLVHIGTVDAPISLGEVKAIVNEFWRVRGKDVGEHSNHIDVLGWDFAFDLNETAKQMAADANIRLAFKKIPREVLEKKAVEQGDIVFYELAALDVQVKTNKRSVFVELQNFFVPPDDVPEEVRQAITHWSQWIVYWAVDWDYRDDTFHNQWQTYRTRKEPRLALRTFHEYEAPGSYTIVIKVIDILGNDTTKAETICIQ